MLSKNKVIIINNKNPSYTLICILILVLRYTQENKPKF